MGKIKVTIDGSEVSGREGMTILEATGQVGIAIPTLLSQAGGNPDRGLPYLRG